MKKVEFDKLLDSVHQAGDIAAGRRRASRVFKVASTDIKSLRTQTPLSQLDFAALLGVEVSTLRNWVNDVGLSFDMGNKTSGQRRVGMAYGHSPTRRPPLSH